MFYKTDISIFIQLFYKFNPFSMTFQLQPKASRVIFRLILFSIPAIKQLIILKTMLKFSHLRSNCLKSKYSSSKLILSKVSLLKLLKIMERIIKEINEFLKLKNINDNGIPKKITRNKISSFNGAIVKL